MPTTGAIPSRHTHPGEHPHGLQENGGHTFESRRRDRADDGPEFGIIVARATLPIPQSSPIKAMSSMIVDYLDYQKIQTAPRDEDNDTSTQVPSSPTPRTSAPAPLFARAAVDSLSRTSGSFLTTSSPLKSTSAPPGSFLTTSSPLKSTFQALHDLPHKELVDALREAEARDTARKLSMIQMQAGVLLAGMYSTRAQTQLQAQETKTTKKKKGGRRKMGDGKAKYFTGEDFFRMAQQDALDKEEEEANKERRKVDKESHAGVLANWNEAKKVTFTADVVAWEAERDEAKVEKRRKEWDKPKWKDYGSECLLPRPKKPADDDESDSSSNPDADGDSD
ncbi:hypothetical protein B0H16DRAFT_1731440 [Mycena metata]|uniref:Uncharacterized protein n=1 Tax=Mycena metata TaxID=1033252 RepID=A0AAD7I572_9AGAR|nr:hypothetical protein B0H16DRAFT_1731440 [Mycena metata]